MLLPSLTRLRTGPAKPPSPPLPSRSTPENEVVPPPAPVIVNVAVPLALPFCTAPPPPLPSASDLIELLKSLSVTVAPVLTWKAELGDSPVVELAITVPEATLVMPE